MKALRGRNLFGIIILFLIIGGCSDGNSIEGNYDKGIEFAAQGEFSKAKKEFEKILRSDQSNIAARESLKVIEDVNAKKTKSDAAIHFFKGVDHSNKGRVEETSSELTKAIELAPGLAHAYYERGLAYGRMGKYDASIADFSKAIEINPKDTAAYNNRGLAYAKGKVLYEQAFADFNKAIELNSQFAEAYDNRGIAYRIKFNDKAKACADWKRACELRRCDSYRLARKNGYCE